MTTQVFAVRPTLWITDTEADFATGTFEQTVVTDLGDVKLGIATTEAATLPKSSTIVFDMAQSNDGHLYIATGPDAVVWRLDPGVEDPVEIFTSGSEQVFAIEVTEETVLLAISSDQDTRLVKIVDGEPTTICSLPETRYIWDMVVADGHAFLATGTEGRVFRVDLGAQGSEAATLLFDATQSNFLCIDQDASGVLYAGTDDGGLIYRIEADAGDAISTFVLYDANEPEIGTLHVTADGTIYAGTADAKQAKPGRLTAATKGNRGRPAPTKPAPHPAKKQALTPAAPSVPAADAPGDPSTNPPDPATPIPPNDSEPADDAEQLDVQTVPKKQLIGTTGYSAADDPMVWLAAKRDATPAQLDALRKEISRRLTEARGDGERQALEPAETDAPVTTGASPSPQQATPDASVKARKPSKKGNAVYRIGPDRMVEELMRESVMMLCLTKRAGRLIVGTGNDGQVYQIDLDNRERSLLVDLEAQQVTTILDVADGLLVGTASPASLLRMNGDYATEGTYRSKVHDTGQVSLWGRLNLNAQTPGASGIKVELRSGNVKDPDQAAWSTWRATPVLELNPSQGSLAAREMAVDVPPARFIQYRLTLDGGGKQTPVVHRLQLAHVTANQRPRISEVKATYGSGPGKAARGGSSVGGATAAKHVPDLRIEWKATDANKDRLLFDLQFQPDGSTRWIPMAESLTTPRYVWHTQLVPDGRYRLRVIANDRPDNTAGMDMTARHIADPVTVDNTPPRLEAPTVDITNRRVSISGAVVDALSPIASIYYLVDGKEPWLPALPKDLIFDSTREAFSVTMEAVEAGPHVITLKVGDARANMLYHQILLDVE